MRKTLLNGLEQHLEKLRFFSTVARLGSFHAASSELRITQPAISRAIMTLENAINAKLFERSRSGVKLTPEGRLLLDFSDSLSCRMIDLEKRIQNPSDESAGVVQIGTFESLAFYLWPKLLKSMKRKVPSLLVRLVSGDEGDLRARLLSGKIQMVIEAEPREDEECGR